MKSDKTDLVRLKHILEAIELIEEFCHGLDYNKFQNDKMVQSAVIRQFEIIGEAAANISGELKSDHAQVEWRKIKGFRNVLVHEYFRVDTALIWDTIQNELSELKDHIRLIILNF